MRICEYVRIPRIAIVGTGDRAYKELQQEFEINGLTVESVVSQEQFLLSQAEANTIYKDIDALYIDIDESSEKDSEFINTAYEQTSLPLVFSDQETWSNFPKWGRRIAIKLFKSINSEIDEQNKELKKQQLEQDSEQIKYKHRSHPADDANQVVWVLGASLGGPVVVKDFLEQLQEVPKGCFILAQHIGDGFADLLASQLNRATKLKVVTAENGTMIEDGVVIIAPVEQRLIINQDGTISIIAENRKSLYKPCIDFVMQEVAQRYGEKSGAIIFSGMGDDGSIGSAAIQEYGGITWAQDAETCAISSMPDCARETGNVSYTGTPEELGEKLIIELGVLEQVAEIESDSIDRIEKKSDLPSVVNS